MYELLLTKNSSVIIGPVAWVLGKIMEGIFFLLDKIASLYGGTANIGVAIIIFTIIIYLLLLPLTYKQQKFSKMSAKMNPEIQKIQAKYKDNKDPAAMQAMQDETKAVYAKYGVSPSGSCIQLLIQMPILFALYRVIYAIPAYVPMIKNEFMDLVNALLGINDAGALTNPGMFVKTFKFIQGLTTAVSYKKQFKPEFFNIETISLTNVSQNLITAENASENIASAQNTVIDILNRATSLEWDSLKASFPDLTTLIDSTTSALAKYNSFLGINIGYSPKDTIFSQLGINTIAEFKNINFSNASFWIIFVSLMIPILAAVTQWIGVKLTPNPQADNNKNQDDNPMASSMKMMNTLMPIMSLFFCFSLPAGMGIYWIVGAVIRSIQQVCINKYLDGIDIDKVIEENTAKYNEKLKKKGVFAQNLAAKASTNTKFVNPYSKTAKPDDFKSSSNVKKPTQSSSSGSYSGSAKPGSLAAKANMVKDFNEKNNK